MGSIQLKTPIPGPRSRQWMERRNQAVAAGIYHVTPVFIARGEGALLTDVDGNVFIDFAGGIGAINVGHCNEGIMREAGDQLHRFIHTCFSVAPYDGYVRLAEKLNSITPGSHAKKTMLANSGAEAVENAVKIARFYTKRNGVVVFEHAFHGRTLLTMTMTGKVKPYKYGFGPFAPEIYRLPFPYEYRGFSAERCAEHLEDFFRSHLAPEEVACIVMELVLGEGGFVVAPPGFVKAVDKLCRRYEILLVIDEIQTGFARTGKMFACEHHKLVPDLIVLAKSMAGGLPVSAVTGRAEIMDSIPAGGLGGTYGGNPVACAAAVAAIDFIEKQNLSARAAQIGDIVRSTFLQFQQRYSFIGDVRGLGAMMAMEIVKDRQTREPDKDKTNSIIKAAYENGLLLLPAGTYSNVIRTLMPLVITDDQLQEALQVMEKALQ